MRPLALALVLAGLATTASTEPLPSWTDGAAKSAILAFVDAVSEEGGPRFVPEAERIAVFDNDGTLWSEQPVYFQLLFALDQAAQRAAADPTWAATPALRAAAAGDVGAILQGGTDALLEVVTATHSGMTVDAFTATAASWLAEARHPTTGRRYPEMVFQPMLELLDHLRGHGFKTFVVSGGGVDFVRAFAEDAYGIPPEQVIGSMGRASLQAIDGVPEIVKDAGVLVIDDKEEKPLAIQRHVGRRPVFVAGNSDGDLAMAEWSAAGAGPRFVLLVHHTDATREFAYDRASPVGRLDLALDVAAARGWTIVDMARDWRVVWPE